MLTEIKTFSAEEYFNEIKPYLKDVIIYLQKSGAWKNQLKIPINFTSFTDTNEEQVIHSKSDNIEIMTYDNANEIIEAIFQSLLSRYQISLETSIKGSNFVFDSVHTRQIICSLSTS